MFSTVLIIHLILQISQHIGLEAIIWGKKKKVTNSVFLHSVIKPVLKWLTFTLKIKSQLSLALSNMA